MNNELINIKMSDNGTIKSNELVEIINVFREIESNATGKKYIEMKHKSFKAKIEKEVETLKSLDLLGEQNILPTSYIDIQGKEQPCYELDKDMMLQMLNSESTLVRFKTIKYIERLEEEIRNLQEKNKYAELIEKQEEQIKRIEMCVAIKDRHKKMYSRYIKEKLGIVRNNKDYNMIKRDVFNKLGVDKWEDLAVIEMDKVFKTIDDSIDFINKYKQLEFEIKEKD